MEQQRKITDEREVRRVLAAAAAAGGTLKQWAQAKGIDGRSLNAWRVNLARRGRKAPLKKRRAEQAQPPSSRRRHAAVRPSGADSTKEPVSPVLVELVSLPAAAASERRYVVRLGDFCLELGDDFDPRTLRRLLEVLRAC